MPRLLPLAVVSVLIVAAWTWMARAVIVPYLGEITNNSLSTIIHLATGGAGHAFFYYHTPMYRPQPAMDGWEKVFSFFQRHLG